jgi:hypothetical protein
MVYYDLKIEYTYQILVELKLTILDKVHKKPYSGHPGYQKMVATLRKLFYWPNMKGETT